MVLLSRILPYRANRWANIGAGVLHTASVAWSMSEGTINLFYAFFATIEIATTLFIVWYAWKWLNPEARVLLPTDQQVRRDADALVPTR
jgi:poly(A) polymerase Pap1